MLRITVELIPHGDESRKQLFGVAEITLKRASEDAQIGDYECRLSHTAKWYKPNKWWMVGKLTGFRRLKETPWKLITMAMASCWLKD